VRIQRYISLCIVDSTTSSLKARPPRLSRNDHPPRFVVAQGSQVEILTSPTNQLVPNLLREYRLTAGTCPSPPFLDIAFLFNCRICATIMTEKTTTKNMPATVHPTIKPALFLLVLLSCQLWICLVDVHDLLGWFGGYCQVEQRG
jgi:hypothetical protein